jgi:transposase InsO family protein
LQINSSFKIASKYFGQLAQKDLDAPGLQPRRYSVSTFKSWLRRYRRDGFQGLLPKQRSDAGSSRVVSTELLEQLGSLLAEFPRIPVRRLRERLIAGGWISSPRISESTLRRLIRSHDLRPGLEPSAQPRKHFEKPHANDLWTLDFMHGPRVRAGRGMHKTFLAAAIDDHSRFLTLARFAPREDSPVVVSELQRAFARHGLPLTLYCDNGSPFSSRQLTLGCARLGVALVHSKPYDPASRGKIERFFRTLRGSFLSLLDPPRLTIQEINDRLDDWLENDYHRRLHSSLGETPLERYFRSLASIRPRRVSRAELDRVFYRTLQRTVRRDSTVSIQRILWEVPPRLIGRRVEIRHPEGRPHELYLFENNQPAARLHRVDAAQNATSPRRPRFSLHPEDDQENPS